MKKNLMIIAMLTACAFASQSYGMQIDKNQYFVYNNTPDATIAIAGIGIGPNSKFMQLKNAGSDRIELHMPNDMRMAFNAPGHYSISLAKLIDQDNPAKLAYKLVLLNMLTAQVAMDKTITPAPAAQCAPKAGQ